MLEHALFIDPLRDLDTLIQESEDGLWHVKKTGFSRLYFGTETCNHRMPDPRMLERVIRLCADVGLQLTFVTPPLYDSSFPLFERLIRLLPPATEVVLNDFGAIEYVRKAACLPVFGRTLNRVVRDPRIELDVLPEKLKRFTHQSLVHAPLMQEMLRDFGFVRVELDNVPQGLDPLPEDALPCSLVFPHMLVTLGRFCGTRFAAHCPGRPCFDASTFVNEAPLIYDGVAAYSVRPVLPQDLRCLRVDRLVRQVGPEGVGWLFDKHTPDGWSLAHRNRIEQKGDTPFVTSLENDLLDALSEKVGSVLELGCGIGSHLATFARRGKRVLGIDVSWVAVDRARSLLGDNAVILGDFLDVDIDGPFDLIMDLGSVHAVAPKFRTRWAERIKRALSANGLLLTFTFIRDERLLPQEPVYLVEGRVPEWGFTKSELQAILGPELELVWSRDIPADMDGPPKWLVLWSRPGVADIANIVNFLKNYDGRLKDTSAIGQGRAEKRAWLDNEALLELAGSGLSVISQDFLENGSIMLEGRFRGHSLVITFIPLETPVPHYRVVSGYQVAYRGFDTPVTDVDAVIALLVRFLPPKVT